jgi:phage FluMu protein gp41
MLKAAEDINKPSSINEPSSIVKQPSMAFFEYLADQVEVEGKLVGPMDMQNSKSKLLSDMVKTSSKHSASNKASSENEQQERGSHK